MSLRQLAPNPWIWIGISVGLLALATAASSGSGGAPAPFLLAVHLGLRTLVYGGAAYGLVRFAKRSRFQALALIGLIGFIDQVLIKSAFLVSEMRAHPSEWEGIAESTVLYGMAVSYIYFLPIVLVMGFVGTFAASQGAAPSAGA